MKGILRVSCSLEHYLLGVLQCCTPEAITMSAPSLMAILVNWEADTSFVVYNQRSAQGGAIDRRQTKPATTNHGV